MPRRAVDEDEAPPRRRRSAKAVAVEAEAERGLAMRILLHSPKDMVAGLLAFAAVTAIVTNALFLQAGPHPSPMFGSVVVMPAPTPSSSSVSSPAPPSVSPLPRPRPVEVSPPEPRQGELKSPDAKPDLKAEAKVLDVKPPEVKVVEPRTPDSMTSLVKASTASTPTASIPATSMPATTSAVLRPPAPIPAAHNDGGLAAGGSRRIAAVQRALTEFGYGQLRPSGIEGPDTRIALAKFERDRRLPVTAQISDRLIRELSTMTGHPIE